MVDSELNNFEHNDAAEKLLRSFAPRPFEVHAGQVMFEAGRAVGREQALAESQTRFTRSLSIWRFATAASLALALFSLIGHFNSPSEKSNSVAEMKVTPAKDLIIEQTDSDSQPSNTPRSVIADTVNWTESTLNSAYPSTVIELRRQLFNSDFDLNFDPPAPTPKYAFEKPKNALELLHQYTQAEEL